MNINSRTIGPGHTCYMIAEIGFAHGGDRNIAIQMIKGAAAARVDCVKFQHMKVDSLVSGHPLRQKVLTDNGIADFRQLCKNAEVDFLCTPHDIHAVSVLTEMRVNAVKVGSGALSDPALLKAISKMNLPTFMSTGMHSFKQVEQAVTLFDPKNLILLHCVSLYPTPPEKANLGRMASLRAQHGAIPIGYSDHTVGMVIPLAAVARGACVLEKHMIPRVPDREARDTPGALSAFGLSVMVKRVREIEAAMMYNPSPQPEEAETLEWATSRFRKIDN